LLSHRRVKIVATIGPATNKKEQLTQCIQSGMNVARLNFSHGTHEDHFSVIERLRECITELEAPVTILQDLQGPKIRVGHFENDGLHLEKGNEVVVSPDFEIGKGNEIPTDFKELPGVCTIGTKILLDDGLIELKVLRIDGSKVLCEVIFGGLLKNRKGMNIPGASLPIACMTDKDHEDLEFGLSNNVDYVALSFVRTGNDIKELRKLINNKESKTKIIAKIEMSEAIDNLDEIVELSDAVMVARGDLAVEVGQTRLPFLQKQIINLCNDLGKPVITATQMLDSMVDNPRPTRAEITDVANAVLDGSDALMLSAESASGNFPFACIHTMGEIISEVEKTNDYYHLDLEKEFLTVADSIAASACLTALKLNASAIICLTTSGKTATMISAYRPKAQIIAVTHLDGTLNQLALTWGIQTFNIDHYTSSSEAMKRIEELLLTYGLVKNGDNIVFTLGLPVSAGAKTNSLRVISIDNPKVKKLPKEKLPLRCR
jgi:pyruvate kinase